MKYVRKRDGRLEEFDSNRITVAIWKAARAVGGSDKKLAKKLVPGDYDWSGVVDGNTRISPAVAAARVQMEILRHSTHFNPVDIVCWLKPFDKRDKNFDLTEFRDNSTGFIAKKSKDGRELKALELPGLWNGSMSDWNTIFAEVPLITFNPVKTINDLLKKGHCK